MLFTLFKCTPRCFNLGNSHFGIIFPLTTALLIHSIPAYAAQGGKVAPTPIATNNAAVNTDALLNEIFLSIAQHDTRTAQTKLNQLLQAYPNFQLAHLIQGDLIRMRAAPVQAFTAHDRASPDKIKDLKDEAIARLTALKQRPQNLIPSNLLQLHPEQKYAIVVDGKRSRLYLYENQNGTPNLVLDYYITQGKLGVDKFREGDQRTPIGVYQITNRLPGAKLPDFYGPGALPLNYPNEWDKLNGRGGSGIWLHGVAMTNYSRAPLASDGCVVLSNHDFLKISSLVEIGKSPVIITDQIQFIDRIKWNVERSGAQKVIDTWRLDLESGDSNRLSQHYSRNFRTAQNEGAATWLKKTGNFSNAKVQVKLRDVALYKYPNKNDILLANFTQEMSNGNGQILSKKRQYWVKEANLWRIVYEDQNAVSGNLNELNNAPVNMPASAKNLQMPVMAKSAEPKPVEIKNDNKNEKNSPKFGEQTPENKATLSKKELKESIKENLKEKNKDQGETAQIQKMLDGWTNAWSKKNTNAYLGYYARDFKTPNRESRKEWADDRRSRIEGKGRIDVDVENVQIKVDGKEATVRFRQNYKSDRLSASSRKTLELVKQNGRWLIQQESTGK
jgi:murein L,D-transpeptidase YafK